MAAATDVEHDSKYTLGGRSGAGHSISVKNARQRVASASDDQRAEVVKRLRHLRRAKRRTNNGIRPVGVVTHALQPARETRFRAYRAKPWGGRAADGRFLQIPFAALRSESGTRMTVQKVCHTEVLTGGLERPVGHIPDPTRV